MQATESQGRPITPDEAVAVARARFPEASVTGVGLPAGPRGVYRIALREAGDDSARGGIVVFVDPRSSAVLRQLDPATQTRGDVFLPISDRCTKAIRWESADASSSASWVSSPRFSS